MAWLFSNPANFGGEAGQIVFGAVVFAILVYIGIDNIILDPRRKKKELERLNAMIKAHQAKKENQDSPVSLT
jgi:hypothetical protein